MGTVVGSIIGGLVMAVLNNGLQLKGVGADATQIIKGLVLLAACCHASWNYAAKRSGGGLPFVWLTGLVSLCFYAPLAAAYILWRQPDLPAGAWYVLAIAKPAEVYR